MMRVVVSEIEDQQIEPRPSRRDQIREGVVLLIGAVAAAHGDGLVGLDEELLEGVVERVEKIQHVQQQGGGDRI